MVTKKVPLPNADILCALDSVLVKRRGYKRVSQIAYASQDDPGIRAAMALAERATQADEYVLPHPLQGEQKLDPQELFEHVSAMNGRLTTADRKQEEWQESML
jgi:hypothetical protein